MKEYQFKKPQLASIIECTGCLACADSCSHNAIRQIVNDEGFYTYQIDESKCIQCHRCEKVCPIVNNNNYGNNNLNLSRPYAAWTRDNSLRASATSGGVFASLAKNIIQQGGLVVGARQNKFFVKHEIIDNIEDIITLQGSKYTQSETYGIYLQVKYHLELGEKVLFSGVGCQVAALLSFLKNSKYLSNLYTIDLICGGVPTTFLIDKFIEKYKDDIQAIRSYRTKNKYELKIINKSGGIKTISSQERALPINGYNSGLALRYSCYKCPFAFGHRCSDITIGDFWGNEKYKKEKEAGASVAIVHSQKGIDLISQSDLECHEIEWRDFLLNNTRMVIGGNGKISSSRKKLKYAFSHYSYEKLQETYANKGVVWKPWTMIRRFLRILNGKLHINNNKKIVDKLLKVNSL